MKHKIEKQKAKRNEEEKKIKRLLALFGL